MGRWRRLARSGSKLLVCAQRGVTTHGVFWTEPRYLAVHPLYDRVVTPVGPGGRYIVFDGDVMVAEYDFPDVPSVTKTVVSIPFTGTYTLRYDVEVIRRGKWFLNWNDYDRYDGDDKDLCSCGRAPGSYIDPKAGSAYVEIKITEHQSETVFNGPVPSWPGRDRQWKRTFEVSADIDGNKTCAIGDSRWLMDLTGLSQEELNSRVGSVFPAHWEGGESEDVVTYEDRDDADFPVGVDYQRSA